MKADIHLPASIEAERYILGCTLIDKKNVVFDQAVAKLQASDFMFDTHRRIFSRMAELYEAGTVIDFVTLLDRLAANKEVDAVGGMDFLSDLAKGMPLVTDITAQVNIVKDKSAKRTLIHICGRTIDQCSEDSDPSAQIAAAHDDDLMELVGNSSDDTLHVSQFSEGVMNEIFKLAAQGDILPGFSYGMETLDLKTTGVRPKELTIIGARPKEGKTSVLMQAIAANCGKGIPCGLFSIEMNREAILEILWSSVGQIDFEHIRRPFLLTDKEKMKLLNVKQRIDDWPLYIDDNADLTISEICARARLMKRRYGVRLVGLDYMQLISGRGEMRLRMIKAGRALRSLAKSQGLAVIALSQLARPDDKNMNKRPEVWQLKESGSLEADANTIILIFRPVDENGAKTGEDEFLITQRGGEGGMVKTFYKGNWRRFEHPAMRGY